jgi:quinol monooxygenase YgiN
VKGIFMRRFPAGSDCRRNEPPPAKTNALEAGTMTWFAFRIGPATFGIFDTFANEAGLQAHLNGAIATALFAKAEELFAKPPQIQQVEIFAAKPL